jgi:hypothetical protein
MSPIQAIVLPSPLIIVHSTPIKRTRYVSIMRHRVRTVTDFTVWQHCQCAVDCILSFCTHRHHWCRADCSCQRHSTWPPFHNARVPSQLRDMETTLQDLLPVRERTYFRHGNYLSSVQLGLRWSYNQRNDVLVYNSSVYVPWRNVWYTRHLVDS